MWQEENRREAGQREEQYGAGVGVTGLFQKMELVSLRGVAMEAG